MSAKEMEVLADDYTRKYNEFVKTKNPKEWKNKYNQFQKKHQGELDLDGRVT